MCMSRTRASIEQAGSGAARTRASLVECVALGWLTQNEQNGLVDGLVHVALRLQDDSHFWLPVQERSADPC